MTQNPEYKYSELPAIKLFQQLGYQYYNGATDNERSDITDVILAERLKEAIKRVNPRLNSNMHRRITGWTCA